MKLMKPAPTLVVKGIFRKRYYMVLPTAEDWGVYELPQYGIKDQINSMKAGQGAAQTQQGN